MSNATNADNANNTQLSIAIALYNKEDLIERCVTSLTSQLAELDPEVASALEILIVDDGSTDKSAQISQKLAAEHPCVRYLPKPNGGLSSARNHAIAHAQGTYLWLVDADDQVEPGALLQLTSDIASQPADKPVDIFVYKFRRIVGEQNSPSDMFEYVYPLSDARRKELFAPGKILDPKQDVEVFGITPSSCIKVVRTALYREYDITFPHGIWYEDLATTYRLFLAARSVVLTDKVIYQYFDQPGSIMNTQSAAKNLDIITAIQETIDFFDARGANQAQRDHLEFLAITQYALSSYMRLAKLDAPHKKEQDAIRAALNTQFPQWRSNPLLKKMSFKQRALISANMAGSEFMAKRL